VSGARRGRRPRRGGAARDRSDDLLDGAHPIAEALRARRRPLRELRVRAGRRAPAVEMLVGLAREAGVPVRELPDAEGERLPPPGVVLAVGPLPEIGLEALLMAPATQRPRTLVALDAVEDPQNLGAIARVADAAGASGLILTHRHAPPLSPAVSRASAGAIEWLPVARVPNLSRALETLRDEGFWVLGTAADAADSVYDLPDRLADADRVVVLGAEHAGIRPGVARRVDRMLRIPLGGRVASLNVSTAAAAILFELRRRGRDPG
jgi:23S rRNA (guanosine2251-2'-O)-methyltransferase